MRWRIEKGDVLVCTPSVVKGKSPSTSFAYVNFFINTTEERIDPFSIRYMIKPTLHVNKVFRYQVGKLLEEIFHQSTMKFI